LIDAIFHQNHRQLVDRLTLILIANLSRRLPWCGQEFPPTLLDDSILALPFLAELSGIALEELVRKVFK
jgi:hypothetical protein